MQFDPGRVYLYHSGWTMGRVITFKVEKRTKRSVCVKERDGSMTRRIIRVDSEGNESVRLGSYRNAPVIDARHHTGAVHDPLVSEWLRIKLLNETTDRLADY